MNIAAIVSLILYTPLILVFVICSIFFMKSGYKKGLFRSLVSLGATSVAVLAALLLGKIMGRLLAIPLSVFAEQYIPADNGIPVSLIGSVVESAVQAVLSFVLFGLFFAVALIVSKLLARKIHVEKLENEESDKKSMHLVGTGIRFLDAVIVALIMLIPLYGPLSVVTPVASAAISMIDSADEADAQLVKAIGEHPVLLAYKGGPVSWISRSLSTVSFGGSSVDVAKIMNIIEDVFAKYIAFADADGQERADLLVELVQLLREDVIEEDWAYNLIQSIRDNLADIASQNEELKLIYDMTDMDEVAFRDNGIAILEFIEYAFGNGFMTFYQSSDYEALSPEFYERLGALINHSDQAIRLKKLIILGSAEIITEDSTAAEELVSKYISDEPLAKNLQKQEAEAFMRFFFEDDYFNTLEAFVRHPSIAYSDIEPMFNKTAIEKFAPYVSESICNAPYTEDAVRIQLASYDTAPLKNLKFEDYITAVGEINMYSSDYIYPLSFMTTDYLLEDILNSLSDDFFQNRTDGELVKQVLEQALEEAKQNPDRLGYVSYMKSDENADEQVFFLADEQNSSGMLIVAPDGSGAGGGPVSGIDPDSFDVIKNPDGSVIMQLK